LYVVTGRDDGDAGGIAGINSMCGGGAPSGRGIGWGGAAQSTLFGAQNVFQQLRYDRNRQR